MTNISVNKDEGTMNRTSNGSPIRMKAVLRSFKQDTSEKVVHTRDAKSETH